MVNSKLQRYIKSNTGEKVAMHTTSVNLTETQQKFLKSANINLSLFIRDKIDELIRELSTKGA